MPLSSRSTQQWCTIMPFSVKYRNVLTRMICGCLPPHTGPGYSTSCQTWRRTYSNKRALCGMIDGMVDICGGVRALTYVHCIRAYMCSSVPDHMLITRIMVRAPCRLLDSFLATQDLTKSKLIFWLLDREPDPTDRLVAKYQSIRASADGDGDVIEFRFANTTKLSEGTCLAGRPDLWHPPGAIQPLYVACARVCVSLCACACVCVCVRVCVRAWTA